MGPILAVLEQRDGKLKNVSLEVLTAARQLADKSEVAVEAVVLGLDGEPGPEVAAHGADVIHFSGEEAARRYQPDLYSAAVADLAEQIGCSVAVVAATALGKDLGPRVASRLDAPLAGDVTEMDFQDGFTLVRPAYAGKAIYRLKVTAPRCVVTLRPNAYSAQEDAKSGELRSLDLPEISARVTTVAVKESERARLDVAEASMVVSGGRGLKDPDNFHLIEELADALGNAAIGASRAVVDAGWRPHAEQVGQTGKTVSPNLYVAVGISGAIQHLAGMRTAKVIVAINKDKDAPIFKVADYGIVGDLFEIVPRMTEEVKKLRGG